MHIHICYYFLFVWTYPVCLVGESSIENNFPVEFYKHGSTFSWDPVLLSGSQVLFWWKQFRLTVYTWTCLTPWLCDMQLKNYCNGCVWAFSILRLLPWILQSFFLHYFIITSHHLFLCSFSRTLATTYWTLLIDPLILKYFLYFSNSLVFDSTLFGRFLWLCFPFLSLSIYPSYHIFKFLRSSACLVF